MFDLFNLKNLFFILDRGFCSVSNIKEMYQNKMSFIQPLSFNLKKAKALVSKHKSDICMAKNAFRYNEEILYHIKDEIELGKIKLEAHIFYNEKAAIDYKHYLYKIILGIEDKFKPFKNSGESENYLENNIQSKFKKYFKIEGKSIVRNQEVIENNISRSGTIIFIVHGKNLSNSEIIRIYRNRDKIEKEINTLKNQIDTKRIRAHGKDTANGRLFVKFLALIQHSKIMNIIKNDEKLKKYSFCEIMYELKKLKLISFSKTDKFLSELTKKQKLIFKAFNINIENLNQLPSY